MRIIGIDPGSQITGYGIVEFEKNKLKHIDCGGIHIPKKKPLEQRLNFIHEKLNDILNEFKPDQAGIEDVFFAKNAKSSLILGHVRGVILLGITQLGIPASPYSPREVKKAITGFGAATKDQVQYMVKNLLGLEETAFEDASDALAIAICHASSMNLQNRLIK